MNLSNQNIACYLCQTNEYKPQWACTDIPEQSSVANGILYVTIEYCSISRYETWEIPDYYNLEPFMGEGKETESWKQWVWLNRGSLKAESYQQNNNFNVQKMSLNTSIL